MAVKKHQLVPQNQDQVNLATLVEYIQPIVDKPVYMPPPNELIKSCENVVQCLSRVSGTEEELYKCLRSIEKFLLFAINNVDCDIRNEIITAVIDKFYSYISDPTSDTCPATSVVLIVMDASDPSAALTAARWLIQQSKGATSESGMRSALSCLYRWLTEWHSTSALSHWILCFIKVLEENEMFDILLDVSVENIANLFTVMISPVSRHQRVADVILHILISLRESAAAFDVISPYVGEVLESLAADNRQWSRQLLENLVDVLTEMMKCNMNTLTGAQFYDFRDKYAHVIGHLERHMATGTCALLSQPPWKSRKVEAPVASEVTRKSKVGLVNLGNTCYINSVMQALLLVHQFSNYAVLNMSLKPYWGKMASLFVKMMHTTAPSIRPSTFVSVAKPDFFVSKQQHDSSEFLGYLFELLQSYEETTNTDANFDYGRPAVLISNKAVPSVQSGHRSEDHQESEWPCTSSQRPESSSAAGSCTTAQKRHSDTKIEVCVKKRKNHESFVNSLFAGIFLNRITCIHCGSSSLSRDVYRDLQLAFPEKPGGGQYTVQSLIDYYFSNEVLTGENQYKCHDCDTLRDAERSVVIESSPKILILVLKTFKYDVKLRLQTKLMHSVVYNTTVTLPTVRSQQDHNAYNLFAAIVHAGTTLDAGHYYTLGKDNDKWYLFDDSTVKASDETVINKLDHSHTPYMLLYRRKDIEEGGVASFCSLPKKMQQAVMLCNKSHLEQVRKTTLTRP